MSIRVDSASLISGKTVVSLYAGHGIQAQNIPSTGTSGAGYLYNDIAAQGAAATDEMRGELLTLPSSGTLAVNEDSSFSFIGAPDGTYTFTYRGFRNGVSYGDYTVALSIGEQSSSVAMTMPQMSVAISGSVVISGNAASLSFVMPQMTVAGVATDAAPTFTASIVATMPQMSVATLASDASPTIGASVSFTMPQFSVYAVSGGFAFYNSIGTNIETVAASTHLEYTL